MARFKEHECFRLAKPIPGETIAVGQRGTVLLVFETPSVAYEVEFLDDDGRNLGSKHTFTLHEDAMSPDQEPLARLTALPANLQYLGKVFERLGNDNEVSQIDSVFGSLSTEDEIGLAIAIGQLESRNDWDELNRLTSPKSWRSNEDRALNCHVVVMLAVTRRLAESGVEPIASIWSRCAFGQPQVVKPFDWSLIPDEFRFLIPWAERVGPRCNEYETVRLLDVLNETEWASLRELASKVRADGMHARIGDWLSRSTIDGESEASAIEGAMLLLSLADLI